MAVPFNDLKRLYARFRAVIEPSVSNVMASGWWISGAAGKRFASDFAEFVGVQHCIPVANGTDALEIALRIVGCPGQEVITVANAGGYASTASRLVGLKPVYADIDRDTLLLSIASAVSKLTNRTAAVVATHLYGSVVDVPALRMAMNAAGFSSVPIIEDCAQAHGALLNGVRAGSMGDISTFSFYPTKNLGALGDAGAVLTSSDNVAKAARLLHQYGWTAKYRIAVKSARNSRMDEIQAAVLSALLPSLSEMNDEKESIRSRYRSALPPQIQLCASPEGSVAHLVVALTEQRDELRKFLDSKGVATDVHYPVLDCDQEAWQEEADNLWPRQLRVSVGLP